MKTQSNAIQRTADFRNTQSFGTLRGFLLSLLIAALLGLSNAASAQIVFQQGFNAGGVPSDYVGTGPNQFDAINVTGSGVTWSIAGGALQGQRAAANAGGFTRSTDLPLTDGAIIQFSVNFTAISVAVTPALSFSIGTGFDTSATADPAVGNTFARFGISTFLPSATFRIRNSDASGSYAAGSIGPSYSGSQTVFWVVNTSGSALSYTGPNGSANTVGPDAWDIWVGTDLIMDEHAALTSSQGITDLKFRLSSGTETVLFDDVVITKLPIVAAGADLTWTAGSGTWNTSTVNWTNALGAAVAYTDASDKVVFSDAPSGSGPFTVTLNSSLSPASLLVSNVTKNYTISGSGGIAGGTGLIKDGAGALTLSVANTFGGGTTVSNGTLTLSGSGTLGASSGALTVSGGTVNLGGTSQSAGTVTLSGGTIQNGILTGTNYALQSGTVSAALAGGVALTKTTAGTVSLSGPNTYTGGTAINSGTLQVNAAENPSVSGPLGASGSISLGGGTLQYSLANNYDYSSRFNSPAVVNIDLNGQAVIFATVIGSGSLTLGDSSGGGTLTLSAANSYAGGTTINSGTLRLSGAGKPGSVNWPMTMNGGTCDLNGISTTVGAFNGGAGAQVVNNGGNSASFGVCNNYTASTANFQGTIADGTSPTALITKHSSGVFTLSAANTYSGNTTVTSGGQLKLAHSQAIQNSTLLSPEGIVFDSSVASHAFTFGGLSGAGNLALEDNAGPPDAVALTVGKNSVSTTHSGILSGSGSFIKLGTGRLILTGPNTYTGATVVSNGMLVINGVSASATAVKSNATLGGSGTINASVIVEAGGTISPATFANNVAKLTTGALTLSGGATNVFEIHSATGAAGTDWDLVDAGANNVDAQSTSGSPFTFKLVSVNLNNFDKDSAYSWTAIAGNVVNFAADKFTLDNTGFTNDLAGGYFFLEPGSLKVAFTNNHTPTASPVSYAFAKGVSFKPFNIPIASFLANNTADPDGDARALVSLTSTNALVSTNATDITISSINGLAERISYVVRDLRSSYRAGDSVRMATNYINIVRTNAVGAVSIENLGATNMTLSFYGIPDYSYVIQRSPDMSAWADVVTNSAAGNGLVQYTETPPHTPAFYRMRQE